MRKLIVIAAATLLVTTTVAAQKVLVPSQSSDGTVKITPQTKDDQAVAAAKRIKRDEALKLVQQGKAVFVDVRSVDSYNMRHIKGAISMPGSQLLSRIHEIPQDKMAITYCACVEEHTAAVAVVRMNQRGIKNAAALVGGWNEWVALGLPTEGSVK